MYWKVLQSILRLSILLIQLIESSLCVIEILAKINYLWILSEPYSQMHYLSSINLWHHF